MSLAKLGDFGVITARIELPLRGAWGATVELDTGGDAAPSGAVSIVFESSPAVSFAGTIIAPIGDGAPIPGRSRVFVCAGASALRGNVAGKPYESIAPRLVIEDIVADAGETIESLEGVDALSTQKIWVRPKGTGTKALLRFLAESGLAWRFNVTGKIIVLADAWPAYTGEALLESPANELGRAVYALESPDLLPGMTLDSKKVSRVVHCVRRDGTFRTEVMFL